MKRIIKDLALFTDNFRENFSFQSVTYLLQEHLLTFLPFEFTISFLLLLFLLHLKFGSNFTPLTIYKVNSMLFNLQVLGSVKHLSSILVDASILIHVHLELFHQIWEHLLIKFSIKLVR